MIVQVEGLAKKYNTVNALKGIDFQVNEGEIFGLMGPNGAGKSTAIKILTTLIRPTSGTAQVCGIDVEKNPNLVRKKIGYVCQNLTSDEYLTGRENLILQGNLYHLSGSDLRKRIDSVLELVGLSDSANRQVEEYSGGMRKRLDIACGLLHDPEILFLDEPTLGLDPTSRMKVWDYIKDVNKKGTSVILCTNYLEEADRMCNRVGIIDEGELRTTGNPDDLKKNLGGDVITLTLANSSKVEFLRDLSFVKDLIEVDTELKIFVDSNEEAIPKILGELSSKGMDVNKISYSRPTLDEVFVKHTGRRME